MTRQRELDLLYTALCVTVNRYGVAPLIGDPHTLRAEFITVLDSPNIGLGQALARVVDNNWELFIEYFDTTEEREKLHEFPVKFLGQL
jgi:hypothetical protein